jgi:hypothetical protein
MAGRSRSTSGRWQPLRDDAFVIVFTASIQASVIPGCYSVARRRVGGERGTPISQRQTDAPHLTNNAPPSSPPPGLARATLSPQNYFSTSHSASTPTAAPLRFPGSGAAVSSPRHSNAVFQGENPRGGITGLRFLYCMPPGSIVQLSLRQDYDSLAPRRSGAAREEVRSDGTHDRYHTSDRGAL